jgi:hypothetical protein
MVQRNRVLSLDEVSKLIRENRTLAIFGTSRALKELPNGNWIGGVVPDLYTASDTKSSNLEKLLVCNLSELAVEMTFKCYDQQSVKLIRNDSYKDGFTFLILPAFSEVLKQFYRNTLLPDPVTPVVGVVAGSSLSLNVSSEPKTFFGLEGHAFTDFAVAVHIKFPNFKVARIVAVNIFEPKAGPVIEVDQDSFSISKCRIDGVERNFCEYVNENDLDMRFPLTFVHQGQIVNASFGGRGRDGDSIWFYSPLLKGIKYYPSKTFDNYPSVLRQYIRESLRNESTVFFNCNGYLNFVHGELGRGLAGLIGPGTLGEVAMMVHNQVFSYMVVDEFELLSFTKVPIAEISRFDQ